MPGMTSMVRQDAREVHQLRRQGCEIAVLSRADGSASFTQGKTTVLASVFGKCVNHTNLISLSFHSTPGSTNSQGVDRSCQCGSHLAQCCMLIIVAFDLFLTFAQGGGATVSDARCERIIQECVSSCLLLHEAPRSLHSVAIQVVEDDGSALACAVNALSLALLDAAIPMKHSFSASASAVSNSQIFLDPDLNEETVHIALMARAEFD